MQLEGSRECTCERILMVWCVCATDLRDAPALELGNAVLYRMSPCSVLVQIR